MEHQNNKLILELEILLFLLAFLENKKNFNNKLISRIESHCFVALKTLVINIGLDASIVIKLNRVKWPCFVSVLTTRRAYK